jgi:hypothetical protein
MKKSKKIAKKEAKVDEPIKKKRMIKNISLKFDDFE